MHRFNANLKINDKEATAKITLFEKIEGKNRIYTLELEELQPASLSAGASSNTEAAVNAQSLGDIAHEAPTIAKTDKEILSQKHKYFNEQSPNIYHSNAHLTAGVAGGSLNGIEQDEQGNIIFNPQSFVKGFLAGSVGSFTLSKGWSLVKQKYYEKRFNQFIKLANENKNLKAGFEVSKELEKNFKENEVKMNEKLINALNLKGKVFADYIKLAQKHPEYFSHPQEIKALVEYIAQNPNTAIPATKQGYELIFANLQGGKGVFALDLEYKGGKHRIRSVYLMTIAQFKRKLYENKKQGGPTLQF